MGVPAQRIDVTPKARKARPRLKVAKSPAPPRRRACDQTAAARRAFSTFVVLTLVVCVLGMGRVWLSVQAAQASLDAGEIMQEIKAERYRGDMLEIQQSALSSPSRIRAIAGATMDMTIAGDITYIDLPPEKAVASKVATRRENGLPKALGDVLSLAAGEAQVLLVGDVGLASAR